MSWDEIMNIKDPHRALLTISKKTETEDLGLVEMEDRVQEYANLHGITTDEMSFYPYGERAIHG